MRRTRTIRVGELVDDLFRDPEIRRKIAEGRIPETWREVSGPAVAAQTTAVEFKSGILTVRIASSVVRHELFMRRAALRDTLNARLGFSIVREVIVR